MPGALAPHGVLELWEVKSVDRPVFRFKYRFRFFYRGRPVGFHQHPLVSEIIQVLGK